MVVILGGMTLCILEFEMIIEIFCLFLFLTVLVFVMINATRCINIHTIAIFRR